MKVYRQWVPCEHNSSYNFIPIFLKLCTCFRHGLEMCMWFGYNPWTNFCHFFHFVNFVIFCPQILWKCIDSGYHVRATPYTTSCLSLLNFAHLFVHGLKMCMWFGFNPAVNFCHFSTLTLSFFAGATSTSPRFDLYLGLFLLFLRRFYYFFPKILNSVLVSGKAEGAGDCTIYPRASGGRLGSQTPGLLKVSVQFY